MEGHADWVTAVLPVMEGGRKVRAPLGRVLGNSQVSISVSRGRERKVAQKHTVPMQVLWIGIGIRVKSDGKSVRPLAVTQRRLNPTWSKAK